MEVLVVAKTKWSDYYCVSGIEIISKKYIRLMQSNGKYQELNTPFKIGQIWDLEYTSIVAKPPHVEDVAISKGVFVKDIANIKDYILENCTIWNGTPTCLFDGKLKWENGSGYLNEAHDVPSNSVGFWVSDKDLSFGNEYYYYQRSIFLTNKRIKYKGIDKPIGAIPAGTLIRVSLAKWWQKDAHTEPRCYLQLSGWYNN